MKTYVLRSFKELPGSTPKVAPLTDQSLMPFGIHKDKTMEKVPADYLLWLRDQGCRNPRVAAYIEDNIGALMKECPDYTNE